MYQMLKMKMMLKALKADMEKEPCLMPRVAFTYQPSPFCNRKI